MSEAAAIIIPEGTALSLQEDVEQLGRYLIQMGSMMQSIQQRMDELEEKQKKITITHMDVKELNAMIRMRGAESCAKYELKKPGDEKAVRGAIKKAVLKRYGIQDLHDVPEIALKAVQNQIEKWADIRLMMKRRELRGVDGS